MIPLSPRLSTIYELIDDKLDALADIGCDHGYILVKALYEKKISRALAVDISAPSLKKSASILEAYFPSEIFDCRLGDGLQVLDYDEVQSCVIAGMGGVLISEIISDSLLKARSMDSLILQPMQAEEELFEFLNKNAFSLIEARIAREKNKFYPILKVSNKVEQNVISWESFLGLENFSDMCRKKMAILDNIQNKIPIKDSNKLILDDIREKKERWETLYGKGN